MAVADARVRASTIAEAAGAGLGSLLEIAEGVPGGPEPRPLMRAARFTMAAEELHRRRSSPDAST